jgi:hypothetical protein
MKADHDRSADLGGLTLEVMATFGMISTSATWQKRPTSGRLRCSGPLIAAIPIPAFSRRAAASPMR